MTENAIRYTPRAVNRHAYLAIVLVVLAAVVCFSIAGFAAGYKGLLQLLSMMLLVVAIFIASKYIFVSYEYIITQEGEDPAYFLIEERQGKRTSLVCQIPLRYILSVTPWDRKTCPAGRFSTFTASMDGGSYSTVHAREAGQDIVVKIEADDAFLAALRDAVNAASE